jgi:hypothetical protein
MQNFIGRTTPAWLSVVCQFVPFVRNSRFSAIFPDSSPPAVITAEKTIGAYTESISVGPELMLS